MKSWLIAQVHMREDTYFTANSKIVGAAARSRLMPGTRQLILHNAIFIHENYFDKYYEHLKWMIYASALAGIRLWDPFIPVMCHGVIIYGTYYEYLAHKYFACFKVGRDWDNAFVTVFKKNKGEYKRDSDFHRIRTIH